MAAVSKICWDYFVRHSQELDVDCCSFCWTKLDILSKLPPTRITNVGAYQQVCVPSSRPTVYLQNFSYTHPTFSWNRTWCRKVTPKNLSYEAASRLSMSGIMDYLTAFSEA